MVDSEDRRTGERSGPKDQRSQAEPAWKRLWLWVVVALVVSVWLRSGDLLATPAQELSYDVFLERLEAGEVQRVWIEEGRIRGLLTDAPRETAAEGAPKGAPFRTVRVEDPELVERLQAAGIAYEGVQPSTWGLTLFSWLLPFALFALFLSWMLRSATRQAGTGALGFGKSKARLVPEHGTGVSFADVAGVEEAKADLAELVEFLRNPGRFTHLGASIPKGVLLLGPPGTGKTLLARAVAGEADVPFFTINGSDFVEMFVGVGAARVRDLFSQAKAKAPCIVFIDEIDAVGRQRGVSMGVVNDEREQTLNQLLSEMDGFEPNSGVILLAATNRPEILDRALLRPGRFDRQIVLDAPDRRGREAILRVHARGKPMAGDVDLEQVARATPGMSGADLRNALNEAALAAGRERRTEITQADIEVAIERVIAGPEKRSRRLGPEEKRRVAIHESGHALVASLCEHADPVQKISIVPRGRAALGYTLQLPTDEQLLKTTSALRDRLEVLVAGRAAEELVLGEASTGAEDDLRTATALARQMVCLFGMNARVGLQHCAREVEGRFLPGSGTLQRDCSEATAREIDEEVRELLAGAHAQASAKLRQNEARLARLAAALIEHETLDRAAFERLLAAAPAAVDGSTADVLERAQVAVPDPSP